ncbi:MAG: HU family DNA-binding protein [Muribaculaceae bacterium]|nr:HU family DNA-binding protein [Muribaculaceae bacterium]
MNEKITIQRFAAHVAGRTDISFDVSLKFIRALFGTVAEELHKGEPVSIKGLGTFALSHAPGNPVDFQPAKTFSDTVNAPFAMFEPEVLAADVTDEMIGLEKAEETETTPAPASEPERIQEPPCVPAEEKEHETALPTDPADTDTDDVDDIRPEEANTQAEPEVYPMPPIPPVPPIPSYQPQIRQDEQLPPLFVGQELPITSQADTEYPQEDEELYAPPQKESRASRFAYGLIIGVVLALGLMALLLVLYTALS